MFSNILTGKMSMYITIGLVAIITSYVAILNVSIYKKNVEIATLKTEIVEMKSAIDATTIDSILDLKKSNDAAVKMLETLNNNVDTEVDEATTYLNEYTADDYNDTVMEETLIEEKVVPGDYDVNSNPNMDNVPYNGSRAVITDSRHSTRNINVLWRVYNIVTKDVKWEWSHF